MTTLAEPLREVVGARTAKALADEIGVATVGDLLRHYPRRYAERGELTDLDGLREGEHVTVVAEVARVASRRMRNRPGSVIEVVVTDGHGKLVLTFFNQPWRERELVPGRRGLFSGKVSLFRGRRQLAHPDYQLLPGDDDGDGDDGDEDTAAPGTQTAARAAEFAGEIIPVYPATQRLASWKIAQCVRLCLDTLRVDADPLPSALRDRHRLMPLAAALHGIHRPRDRGELARARERLKWDEAFVVQVALATRRAAAEALPAAPRPRTSDGLLARFDSRLPFALTEGQREVGEQIAADLAARHPMHRLLMGDVGSGKTVCAVRAMLQVVDAGGQAALLAPTEVLAQQHHRSINALLGPLARGGMLGSDEHGTRVALLTGSQGTRSRRQALLDVACGAAGIVVGTHALLQEHVQFADLGLVVIDEQHRFGVEQRDALREKASRGRPHVLVMTATPIPRTVAMTVYGDLDVSELRQLPAGRVPIATHVVPAAEKPRHLARVWERIREEVAQGRQAYVVCPRIGDAEGDEGDLGDLDEAPQRRPPLAVLDVAPMLADGPLSGLRLAVLHGRLAPDDKDETMRRFAAGEIDVLIATTVVEVGVDVPNASVMAVMDADRFGVSQLHQLRGRVGRGSAPGLCLLVTEAAAGSRARERLDAVAATLDGFALSRVDLEQRREGDVLGVAQSGRRSTLRLLTLLRDEDLIREARDEARALVAVDPTLAGHPALKAALAELIDEERVEFLEKA